MAPKVCLSSPTSGHIEKASNLGISDRFQAVGLECYVFNPPPKKGLGLSESGLSFSGLPRKQCRSAEIIITCRAFT